MNRHGVKIRPRYGETDQMGIIYHGNYFLWYEVARTTFLKEQGLSYRSMEEMGVLLPVIEVSCQYRKSALYDDDLEVFSSIDHLTPTRLSFVYEIVRDGEETIATGKTHHVYLDPEKKRPMNLKRHFPEIYELLKNLKAAKEV